METIEKETLNYLRLAFYGMPNKDIALKIGRSRTTVTNALSNGIATKETETQLLDLAKEINIKKPVTHV